ncbi:sensor histidine kinase [Flexivirga meconopsidis]|uniref:sensor histidine kinase n=1 Tax=Flexivirga meconopsidis TaxID=2977121 RepID=UPI00223FFC8C|nr:histidine kinase [Flexivirga meconopsidis]
MTSVPAEPMRRPWWQRHAVDVVALFFGVAIIGTEWHQRTQPGQRPLDALGIVLGLVAVAGVLAHHWRPVAALLVPASAIVAYLLLHYPNGPIFVLGPLGLFVFGFSGPRQLSRWLSPVVMAVVATCALLTDTDDWPRAAMVVGWSVVAILLADLIRTRFERSVERRIALQQQRKRAEAEQQLELARDLHDSVAHALTAINVQAALAERVVHSAPDEAVEAARAIRMSSRDALAELNAIVRSLREPGAAPTRPQHCLSAIDVLIERAREAGLTVEVELSLPAELSDDVQAASYRVVQESLTNAVRYAPGSHVRLRVRGVDGGLQVSAADDGAAPGETVHPPGGGHGLIGMAERVRATGGTLRHGPSGPGFVVEARWESV